VVLFTVETVLAVDPDEVSRTPAALYMPMSKFPPAVAPATTQPSYTVTASDTENGTYRARLASGYAVDAGVVKL
jgi:hypothetical protein